MTTAAKAISSRHRLAIVLCCLLVLATVSLSCQLLRSDVEPVEHVRLDSPAVNYEEVAWLSDSVVAFMVTPAPRSNMSDERITLFNVDSGEWMPQNIEDSPECTGTWRRVITRLAGPRLGFIETCIHHQRQGISERHESLLALDPGSGAVETLQRYAWPSLARAYDVSTVNGEVLQALGEGNFSSELHRYIPGESPLVPSPETPDTRLLSNYRVLKAPVWSPDGETVAVLAAGEGEISGGMTFRDLDRQRWNVVLLNTRTGEQDVVLDGIQEGAGLKWSPHGDYLAFHGGYKRQGGVWLYDLAEDITTAIWPVRDIQDWTLMGNLDFSPDGRQMVILHDPDGYLGPEFAHPVIIDVPYPEP
ncbi:MAG: hypothetical protein WD208_11095 [Dehalococcoidia bacterium]